MQFKAATSILTMVCCFTMAVSCLASGSQEPTAADKELHYYTGIHQTFDPTPNVSIWSFTSTYDSTNDVTIVLTGLKNWSQKPAVAVRIGWYLTRNEDYKNIIVSGQTDLIEFDTLTWGETINNLRIPMVAHKDVLKSLKGTIPPGDLFLGVAVNEVHFADGSIWKLKLHPAPPAPLKAVPAIDLGQAHGSFTTDS